mmetsp:Transcript_6580/g.19990  ORF Transcript_6580/g.19990 Transcript_6580/m.19990 type:complete len:217 (+) Transcript_6580:1143-1793(+)
MACESRRVESAIVLRRARLSFGSWMFTSSICCWRYLRASMSCISSASSSLERSLPCCFFCLAAAAPSFFSNSVSSALLSDTAEVAARSRLELFRAKSFCSSIFSCKSLSHISLSRGVGAKRRKTESFFREFDSESSHMFFWDCVSARSRTSMSFNQYRSRNFTILLELILDLRVGREVIKQSLNKKTTISISFPSTSFCSRINRRCGSVSSTFSLP